MHTETKYTPHELVFGKSCKLPNNFDTHVDPLYNFDSYPLELKYRLQMAQNDARHNLIQSKQKRKEVYDRNTKPVTYCKGNQLLLKNETGDKFESVYKGPYLIIDDLGCNVKILRNGKEEIVHKNRTIPYT